MLGVYSLDMRRMNVDNFVKTIQKGKTEEEDVSELNKRLDYYWRCQTREREYQNEER